MKLIDKDALVSKIDNILDYIDEHWDTDYAIGAQRFADKLQDAIDTLEMKEVDLEKEIKEQSDKYYSQCEKKLQEMDDNDTDLSFLSLDNFAKHFFELGLKAARKGE